MKIYGHPMSTCTRKVLMTLAEKGHSAEVVLVDIMKGEQKGAAHLARQPFGVIPVLEDDDYRLYESRAIIRYLDARLPGPALTPSNLGDRGRMEQWISIEMSCFTQPAVQLIRQLLFGRAAGLEPNQQVVAEAQAEVERALDVADQTLATQPYLAGDMFTLAEVCWMPYLEYLFPCGLGEVVLGREHVGAWWRGISARPTWQRVAAR